MTQKLPYSRLAGLLVEWFAENARDLPWRRTEDPYAVWVSEVMLQQTQVRTVVPYWTRWMARFPTIAALAAAEEREVLKHWEGLGYYRRARNLWAGARQLADEGEANVPGDWGRILALPGVGPYTAGAIASIAFDQARPILDGNVTRVLARVGAVKASVGLAATRKRLWGMAEALVAAADGERAKLGGVRACSMLNQALMELGATVCAPRSPACGRCPIREHCRGRELGLAESLPRVEARPATLRRATVGLVVGWRSRLLVRQRPDGGVNPGLWEFPTLELPEGSEAARLVAEVIGPEGGATPWFNHKHSITRHRIELRVWRVACASKAAFERLGAKLGAAAMDREALRRLPYPSAQAKILRRLDDLAWPGGPEAELNLQRAGDS